MLEKLKSRHKIIIISNCAAIEDETPRNLLVHIGDKGFPLQDTVFKRRCIKLSYKNSTA